MNSAILALIMTLLPAIAKVESDNNPSAIGDKGAAVGIYQIHPAYVKDVNRIANTNFKLIDRYDVEKSKQMVTTYLWHYGKAYIQKTGKLPDFEVLARIHNGGPDGWKKKSTMRYWEKVKRELGK